MIRCAIYTRVSTEEQHINGLSLPAQRKALEEFAEKNEYQIVGYYADEGFSARKPMSYRKELLRLLEDVKQNKIDMILVTKLDRWFRNIKDYNITEEILKNNNCYWKTIFENYDSSTANGQMVINIMLSVNQAECDRTSERIKSVFDYKRSNGEVISGRHAPYGYAVKDSKLIKDPDTRHIVEDAFQYYFDTLSIRSVYYYITEKYGLDAPSYNMIDRFFKTEKYAGIVNGIPDYCEGYITPEQYKKIRKVSISKTSVCGNNTYIFSSLIKCPICGNNMSGFKRKYKRNGNLYVYPRYRCNNKFARHNGPIISESVVERYMLENLIKQLDIEVVAMKEKEIRRKKYADTKNVEAERDRLNILYQKGRIDDDYYNKEYDRLTNIIDNNKIQQMPSKVLNNIRESFDGNWKEIYSGLDASHKQVFWKSKIESIQIDPKTNKICGFKFLT